jgi:transposase
MRGTNQQQDELFCTISIDSLIPEEHPLRRIRECADAALKRMEPEFTKMYSSVGRPGVAPERLLRALLVQVLYGYQSERRLMTELRYNFALRWFVGLTMGEEVWDVTVFTKNRARLLESDLAQRWLKAIVLEASERELLDQEHFSVDGTLIQAWASERSYREKANPPKPGEGTGRRGTLLKRDLYESKTDPEARIFRKSFLQPWQLCYVGNLVTENRHGLIVAAEVDLASKTAERQSGLRLLQRVRAVLRKRGRRRAMTVGADKAYHEQDFVQGVRALKMEPHIGAYRRQRIDMVGPAVRETPVYQDSMRKRKWIERCFSWLKEPGRQQRSRFRGRRRVDWSFTFSAGVYNLLRMTRLEAAS